jgi:SAM-dependent methyltransferase
MDDAALPDHVRLNRAYWDGMAGDWVGPGRRNWAGEPHWGLWRIPDSDLGLFSAMAGQDVLEAGCGTAYISAWLARIGARVTGIDNSERQLATARMLQDEFGLQFPLHHGNAETTPFPDASFDAVVSEYGASIWCDPAAWYPECARLLRPGGRLVFLCCGTLRMLCALDDDSAPAGGELVRPYFGMHRFEWPSDPSVEFHLGFGDRLRLLRASGFEVEDIIELQAPEGATTRFDYVTPEWAHRWPSEEIWVARKRP